MQSNYCNHAVQGRTQDFIKGAPITAAWLYNTLNDTGGPNASGGRGWVPLAFGPIYERGGGGGGGEGGGGSPLRLDEWESLAFRHIRAELRSLPRCLHTSGVKVPPTVPSLLVTYLPCAHIKKKKFRAKRGVRPNPLEPPCVRPAVGVRAIHSYIHVHIVHAGLFAEPGTHMESSNEQCSRELYYLYCYS